MSPDTEITARLDANELAEAWEKKKGLTPKHVVIAHIGARTDLGAVRENNEDKFEFFEPEELELLAAKGSFYAVADGMGGHASGQIASELALKTVLKSYYGDPDEDVAGSLRRAFESANSYVFDTAQAIPERSGMGTTCTALVLRDKWMFAAHVGDSRMYIIRDGAIRQVTEDHSWVAEQVRRGALSETEAEFSPFKNVITRSIGTSSTVEVDLLDEEVKPEDVFVLCSDGLSGMVSNEAILEIAGSWSPAMAAMKLIDRANELGGNDNITAVVVAVKEIRKWRGKGGLRALFERQ